MRFLRAAVHVLLVRPILSLLFGVRIEGKEAVKGLDHFVLVANHNSHLDTLFLFQLLPIRLLSRTHPVAALDYFGKNPILFRIAQFLFQPVWIVRGDRESDPLEGMRARLGEGHSLILFPEGTRGEPGDLAPFRKGVGRIMAEFPNAPIVPVYLAGADRALPKATALPLPVWTRVVVGEPLRSRGSCEETTAVVEAAVKELGRQETGRRHRRPGRRAPAKVVAVLGIDGSGKSTLSRELAKRLSVSGKVCLVSDEAALFRDGEGEEVHGLISESLRKAINRRAKAAGSLKSYKVPKLAELFLRDHVIGEVKRRCAPALIVSDGSPLLNMTAWARLYQKAAPSDALLASAMGILSGREGVGLGDPAFDAFPELATMRALRLPNLRCPDGVLFLDVDPSLSMQRIESRGEDRQVHETSEKLERLREGYRAVCRILEGEWGVPARILDGHQGAETVTAAALDALVEMGIVPDPEKEGAAG